MPPLIRSESAAMPAIPSPGSRSCRSEAALGVVPECSGQQQPEQQHADASGCELWRIMRALGDVVTNTGGGGAWHGQQWWPLFTLSLRQQKTSWAYYAPARCASLMEWDKGEERRDRSSGSFVLRSRATDCSRSIACGS
jgi:hypothetical protein